METKRKVQYETPALQVVEISAEGTLCESPNYSMIWTLTGETFSAPANTDFGRNGYGNADSF